MATSHLAETASWLIRVPSSSRCRSAHAADGRDVAGGDETLSGPWAAAPSVRRSSRCSPGHGPETAGRWCGGNAGIGKTALLEQGRGAGVAERVATGATSPEVAGELFLSLEHAPGTVATAEDG